MNKPSLISPHKFLWSRLINTVYNLLAKKNKGEGRGVEGRGVEGRGEERRGGEGRGGEGRGRGAYLLLPLKRGGLFIERGA